MGVSMLRIFVVLAISAAWTINTANGIPMLNVRIDDHMLVARMLGEEKPKRDLAGSDQQQILTIHNKMRASEKSSSMVKLKWYDDAAVLAQTWANKLAKTCKLEHDSMESHSPQKYISPVMQSCGQNIALGYDTWEAAMKAWYDEKQFFTYGSAPTGVTGHYEQIVWDTSAFVGCGFAKCADGTPLHVCNYCPHYRPNLDERKYMPYLKGAPCSQCEAGCEPDGIFCSEISRNSAGRFHVGVPSTITRVYTESSARV
ncbi:PREDICTED: cysteine-rich secretory protein 2-like [Priapulus caudatus]|uniref:Cysteine-rich secretory protein 2-like n=1 Tax=Priapulus caudatus TaxID=37621 RepID=A0ABM1E0L5_PRICU|nr:PREDICTED: cysteine-rich secretory protein 2-like [Priapulus caudatus]